MSKTKHLCQSGFVFIEQAEILWFYHFSLDDSIRKFILFYTVLKKIKLVT